MQQCLHLQYMAVLWSNMSGCQCYITGHARFIYDKKLTPVAKAN